MTLYAVSSLLSSLVMSAIILVILAFNALFSKYFPAKLRYTVWIVLLVGLAIPIRPVISDGLIALPLPAGTQMQYDVYEGSPNKLPARTDSVQDLTTTGIKKKDTHTDRNISPVMACMLVWGIIAAMIFTYHIWRYIRFARMIQRWGISVEEEAVLSIFSSVQAEKGLHDIKISLKKCGFVTSSMLTGFLHPVILLPEKHFKAKELELIFRHELIHYKRRDLLVKLLSVIAVSIHWFNPIVYWMNAAMQTDGEMSCDEAVLLDIGEQNRPLYAELIIGTISGKNTAENLFSTCFYGSKKSVKRRLAAIMDTARKVKIPTIVTVIMFVMLTVLSGYVSALEVKFLTTDELIVQIIIDAYNGNILPLREMAALTPTQARDTALAFYPGGTVVKTELEYEKSRLIYEVKIRTTDGRTAEIEIDDATGDILKNELKRRSRL